MSLKTKISLLKKKADKYEDLKRKYDKLKSDKNVLTLLNFQNNQFSELYRVKCEEIEYLSDKISYLTGEVDDLKGLIISKDKDNNELNLEVEHLEEYILNRQLSINTLVDENKKLTNTFNNIHEIWTKHIHQRDAEIVFINEMVLLKDAEINNLKKQINVMISQSYANLNTSDNLTSSTSSTTGLGQDKLASLLKSSYEKSNGENESNDNFQQLVNTLNNLLSDSMDDSHCIDWHLLDDKEYTNN